MERLDPRIHNQSEMKGRIPSVLLVFLLAAASRLPAKEVTSEQGPDQYADPRLFHEEIEQLRTARNVAREDLDNFSRRIHNVSVLNAPTNRADIIPAKTRPTGTLKLKAVLEANPEK